MREKEGRETQQGGKGEMESRAPTSAVVTGGGECREGEQGGEEDGGEDGSMGEQSRGKRG